MTRREQVNAAVEDVRTRDREFVPRVNKALVDLCDSGFTPLTFVRDPYLAALLEINSQYDAGLPGWEPEVWER